MHVALANNLPINYFAACPAKRPPVTSDNRDLNLEGKR